MTTNFVITSRFPGHAKVAFEYRGIGLQGSTRRIMHDRAAFQYHNAIGQP
jgi:hypothetical protein